MRYSPELAARAAAWLARPLPERRDAAGLLELTQVWAATQGLASAPLCRQCQYSDRVHDLNAYLREYARLTPTSSAMATAETAPTSQYQFAPAYAGQTLTDDAYGKAVTADNLTDKDAEHFISRGFGHVFQKVGAAIEGVGATIEGVGDSLAGDEDNDEPTKREQELQDELDAANQKMADQTASYNTAYKQVSDALQTAQASYDSEKQAHATTTQQLAGVQQQLTQAQAIIAALPPAQLQKATDKANGKPADTNSSDSASQPTTTASDSTSASPAAPASDSTQGDAPASSDASAAS